MKQVELIEKRKPREKHYLREDGTILAEVYDTDIHYLKDGKYEEIDNTLVNENGVLRNKNNDYKVEFKENFKDSLMKMSKDEHYIDFKIRESKMDNIKSDMRKLSKKMKNVTYNNITDDITVEYKALSNKVKETIVLQNANYSELGFELDTNLNLSIENGEVLAKDRNGDIIFNIEKPFMIDSNNIRNDDIHYSLESFDDGYILTLVLDDEWLNFEERAFPVYIDPTISNNGQNISLYDTYIYPGDNNDVRYNKQYLKAGVEKINGQNRPNRTLIKFSLPTIGTGSEIVYATLDLTSYPTDTQYPPERLATIHRITADWNESTANWSNMNDKYEERVESIFYGQRSTINGNSVIPSYNFYDGNITNLVKKWYRDTPNYGVMIKAVDENKYIDEDFPTFYSKDNTLPSENNPKPIFSLVYRNHNGLEDYLDYRTQNFTDGISFVNTYNGNLTTVFNLGHTIGGNLPVSLNLIYNTNDVILNNETFFKKGYKLNLEQTIKQITIDTINYLEYLDEDGTIHYFTSQENSNIFKDEDGLNLTIEKTETLCTMTDENNNKMIFTKIGNIYRLTKIMDIDNNNIDIILNENNSINKVVDKHNNEVSINYGVDNIVIASSDMSTSLNYINNKLTSLETLNGTTIFDYNNNDIISSITDVKGFKIEYEYYKNIPFRVSRVKHIGLNNTIGENFRLEYGFDSTSIIDNNGKTDTLIYNSYGNLLSENSLIDSEDVDNAYSINRVVGEDSATKNKILSEEVPIRYTKNYLKNASFESDINYFEFDKEKILQSYSIDEYVTGNRSLKIENLIAGQSIEQVLSIPKGEYYTFSGYFKSDQDIEIKLVYTDNSDNVVVSSQIINASNEFDRNDITIYYDSNASSDLRLVILFKNVCTTYIDDIQLEKGEVANSFNMIENPDFSEGYSDWELDAWTYGEGDISPDNSFSIAMFNNNKNTALKVSTKPNYGVKFTKTLPVKGKKGDLYTCSFWYKNLGIPGYGPVAGSVVSIYFKPIGGDAGYCIATSDPFHPNEEKWQFFTYKSHAPEDFEAIKIVFLIGREANDFYLTNLSLYKDVTGGEYRYDSNGNLISATDQSNRTETFNYDRNNQLIKMTSVSGKNFKYEYDNEKPSRILSTISSTGISNRIIYDENGNPIRTKISKRYKNEITTGLYKIRNKGTNKYLKAELNLVLLEESECSNTIWKLEKIGEKYKIIYNISPEYSISYRNNSIVLDTDDSNNLFEIEKNTEHDNETYYIKYNEPTSVGGTFVRFLTANGCNVEANTYDENSGNIEFYIEVNEELFIENDAKYTEDSRFVRETTDSMFRKTKYNSNSVNGLLDSYIDPSNHITEYIHNNKKLVTQIKHINKIINYEYDNKNMLKKIIQNNKEFKLDYDDFFNISNVILNNHINFSSNVFNTSSQLLSTTYGTGDTLNFEYDEFGRINKMIKMDKVFEYRYDNNGNLAKVKYNGKENKYNYDICGRLYKFIKDNFKINITYDSEDSIIQKKYMMNDIIHSVIATYEDDLPTNVNLDSTNISYVYDNLDRVISKNVNNLFNVNYVYKTNGKRTTDIIEKYIVDNNEYSYEYDINGNITKVYFNSTISKVYIYDDYNELISEYNYDNNDYIEYTYNDSGNMISKVCKKISDDSLISQHTYSYNNNYWEDQLTSYDNENIEYDNIGNVIKIGNANLSWINGGELYQFVDTQNNLSISYEYDENGVRESKIINGIKTKYYLDQNHIIFEQTGNQLLYFLYDLDSVIGFSYNNEIYYYIKNNQDDVIGIVNSLGEKIITYKYDSWGNVISIQDENNNEVTDHNNVGMINPFRYRSYYYDKETGLYYLKSRYYNPKWGRFISPDKFIGANQDIFGNNLYLYVSNNPINNIDKDGHLILALVVAAVVATALKKSKKKKQKKKASKPTKKSSSKLIPNVTVTFSGSGSPSFGGFINRATKIGYSNPRGISTSADIYKSDSPLTIDVSVDNFEAKLSFQISTGAGNFSKSFGLGGSSFRYEGPWKKVGDVTTRNIMESGTGFFSFYSTTGKDEKIDGGYKFDYTTFEVSKIVVAAAVLAAPSAISTAGKVIEGISSVISPIPVPPIFAGALS